jgi:AdoMet-dependent heme synthase
MIEDKVCTIPVLYNRTLEKNIPFSTIFELTHRCNLRCRQCYITNDEHRELNLVEIKNILDQLAAANTLFLTFTGGEILTRKDFFDIAGYARQKGFAIKLFTNGTLINKAVASKMADIHPVSVGISIYGADAKTHEYYTRVPGSFKKSIQALRYLKQSGVTTVMKILVMKRNATQMTAILNLARDTGAIPQADPNLFPKNNGDLTPLRHRISETQLYNFYCGEVREVSNNKPPYSPGSMICRAGRDICSISPSGVVYPCLSLPVPLGSLREQTFNDIWNGDEVKKLRGYHFEDLANCINCVDKDHCFRCFGTALLQAGDLLAAPESSCVVARIRHRVSIERGKCQG